MSNRSFTKSTRTFIFFPWLDINLKLSNKPQFLYRLVPYTKSLVLNALQNEYHNEYHFWNIFDVILVVKDVSEVKAKNFQTVSKKTEQEKINFFFYPSFIWKKTPKNVYVEWVACFFNLPKWRSVSFIELFFLSLIL